MKPAFDRGVQLKANWGRTLHVFLLGLVFFSSLICAESWPQFLGPRRDGTADVVLVPASWPGSGPGTLWRRNVGQGFSSPVASGSRVILHHRVKDEEVLECFDASTGQTLWRAGEPATYRDDFGFDEGPRATPAMDGGDVFSLGADGYVRCSDLETGNRKWSVSAREKFHAEKGFFGFASSPLVKSNQVFFCLGGTEGAGFVALDRKTGAVLWQADTGEAGYASPILGMCRGFENVLLFARSGFYALDPWTGARNLEFPWRARSQASVNAATPILSSGMVFISASYETGAALLDLSNSKSGRTALKVWSGDSSLSCHYSTPVSVNGFFYGIHGRQESRPALRCIEAGTGKIRWSVDEFGSATLIAAGGHILLLHEKGELLVAKADPSSFKPLARFQILGAGVRSSAALSDGVLYARSQRELIALPMAVRQTK